MNGLKTLLWGLFCACSWTWCIGMYLPKILLDRYGWLGFVAFAVPNVLGCAGFGYVLRNLNRSRRLVEDHLPAATWFSSITVGYHMLFAVALVLEIMPWVNERAEFSGQASGAVTLAFGAMAILFGAGWLLAQFGNRVWLGLTVVVYGVSLYGFIALAGEADFGDVGAAPLSLVFLVPVLCIGFALNPYLDLTFHRALQESPSRHAFGVFGVTFAAMIVFTCFFWRRPLPVLVPIALAHLIAQGVFTVGAHLREIRESEYARCPRRRALLLGVPWAAGTLLLLVKLNAQDLTLVADTWYLRWMVFYGLVFPLYIVLFVGPFGVLPRTPTALRGYVGTILLCAPFFEGAFLQGHLWLLAVPVGGLVVWVVARRHE